MFERFTTEARATVVVAQDEARALRAPRIGPEHLLLGVLVAAHATELGALLDEAGLTAEAVRARLTELRGGQALGAEDAEALRSIGIDLDAVRESLEASFGEDALDRPDLGADERRGWLGRRIGHTPFAPEAKKVIELGLREALARKDTGISAEHLVLGLVRGGDGVACGLIEEHLTTAELRRRVVALLDRAA
ncbi:Clp protease [Rhodococcus spelaei]|uniref:Clp protease n=1 Tax=Rhodococcus spelaei TaxID=2546320 RepID=A0A541B8Q0_9NOCA|nr:Clp protease N-terminal domain-containing protein [Rhodococcus spelaei]TQF68638.1 Clp protease [Rhodococcus spelaei]